MSGLDQLDSEILRRLDDNSRLGVSGLAAQLGVARNTIQARLLRMQQRGVIERFGVILNLDAAGVGVHAQVGLELDQRPFRAVIGAVCQMPHVLEVSIQAGREDLLVRVAARSQEELRDVVCAMAEIPGVRHTNTTLLVATPLRFRTQPLLDMITETSGYGRSTPLPTPP